MNTGKTLAPYIHAMGRGPSRSRSLTQAEAEDAMRQILDGTAAPEAVGALLMLMRFRGEIAEEVAGFTAAARTHLDAWADVPAALDWPTYAAGRSRGLPWFLLSALLVARAGYPVLLHGWNSHQNPVADVREAVNALAIPITGRPDCAITALERSRIAYVPLEAMSPEILSILRLRDVLGLRSAMNTVCRMLNPARAACMVQGVFHPSYRALQQDAGALLGQQNLAVLKGGGGEFERHPAKAVELYGLREGDTFHHIAPARVDAHRRLADQSDDRSHLLDVWSGGRTDAWAEHVVIGTAAAALSALRPGENLADLEDEAAALWHARTPCLAA
ncbi:MAG: glycosyl transferase family protein [Pseudomonadota bacterium]